MTVHSLQTAKDLVSEMGQNHVLGVYSYRHTMNNEQLWAVFLDSGVVDIYDSPFCKDIKVLFEKGKWLN